MMLNVLLVGRPAGSATIMMPAFLPCHGHGPTDIFIQQRRATQFRLFGEDRQAMIDLARRPPPVRAFPVRRRRHLFCIFVCCHRPSQELRVTMLPCFHGNGQYADNRQYESTASPVTPPAGWHLIIQSMIAYNPNHG